MDPTSKMVYGFALFAVNLLSESVGFLSTSEC